MLEVLRDACTRQAILTPHFDHRTETCAHFLSRRKAAYIELKKSAGPLMRRLKLLLSAEVYLTEGVSRLPLLDRLCIPGTRCLPIEMPLSRFDRHSMAEIAHLLHKRKITPVISATERHFLLYNRQDYEKLTSLPDTVYQFTANALQNTDIMHEAVRLLNMGKTVILGSNAHNAVTRRPVDEACERYIATGCSRSVFLAFSLKTAAYFKDAFSG